MLANKIKLPRKFPVPVKGGRYALWRIISILVVGLLLGSALATFMFIYRNIYFTLSETSAIIALNSQLSMGVIDVEKHKRASEAILAKHNSVAIPSDLRYIFEYGGASTTAPSTRAR